MVLDKKKKYVDLIKKKNKVKNYFFFKKMKIEKNNQKIKENGNLYTNSILLL